jgi:hypothetical protein
MELKVRYTIYNLQHTSNKYSIILSCTQGVYFSLTRDFCTPCTHAIIKMVSV